jgi:hypothetical protein
LRDDDILPELNTETKDKGKHSKDKFVKLKWKKLEKVLHKLDKKSKKLTEKIRTKKEWKKKEKLKKELSNIKFLIKKYKK